MFTNIYSHKEVEKFVMDFWERNKIYEKVKERGNEYFFFVDGPPYTTGRIHLGTAWNKVIKDTILRYKRMKGFKVTDKPGWDMHGLPIEVKVEQELGIKEKKEIEEFGIDRFVSRCMEYALKNKDAMTKQFKRLGVWMDWDNPYMTVKAEYINSAWWTIKKASEKGLLERKKMVVNWCPRCETALADAEVEYADKTDPSIYVKFPVKGEKSTYIVIWTTTPWTLPANMAVAVHPSLEYAIVKAMKDDRIEYLIIAKELVDEVLKKGRYEIWEIVETKLGEDLVGIEYEHPLADEVPEQRNYIHKIYMADFVSAENTGCVHIATAHGLEDYELGMKYGIKIFNPVDDKGVYNDKAGKYRGINVFDANKIIIEDLKRKGLLIAEEKITHRYGHCWRCKTPIIYRATEQWFLKISKLKEAMMNEIDKVVWIPEWAGYARFKDWVSNAKDWCISRQRYWGIPIPVWECECGEMRVLGDINEIDWKSDLDLHRPKIDEIEFKCKCGKKMKRVPDVFDVWFDSGVASWGSIAYPLKKEDFKNLWPADFITEGHDQTRGWFYSQLGASIIAFEKAPYKTVLMHGFTLDEFGRKMSKSLGNVVEPEDVIEKIGVDAFRLYTLSSALWEDLKFSWDEANNFLRFLNVFWNVVRFAHTYMSLDKFKEVDVKELNLSIEDRWILSRLENLCKVANDAMENYQLHIVVRRFIEFMAEDFSRWYIQLSRRKVWEEKDSPSKISAYAVMFRVIDKGIRIIAPFAPFIAEYIYQNFVKKFKEGKDSIFMENYPEVEEEFIDEMLERDMEIIRDVSEACYNARQKSKIKLRWPLRELIVEGGEEVRKAVENLKDVLLAQCNVKDVKVVKSFEKKINIKPDFKKLGPILKEKIKDFSSYLESLNQEDLKKIVENGYVEFNGVRIDKSSLLIEYIIPPNYSYSEFSKGVVYLNTRIDEELKREAFARELVRRIQEMRKELDLDVEEYIDVSIVMDENLIKGFLDYIKTETRARNLEFGYAEGYVKEWEIENVKVSIGIKRLV